LAGLVASARSVGRLSRLAPGGPWSPLKASQRMKLKVSASAFA